WSGHGVPDLQLRWAVRYHSVRSSILSLVHPRRSGKLLAVQWRPERRPAVTLSSHMPASALVTGAAGFAGGHLIDLLAADGVRVTAWHRPGGRAPRPVPGVLWSGVDLLDRTGVHDAIRRLSPEVVYH